MLPAATGAAKRLRPATRGARPATDRPL